MSAGPETSTAVPTSIAYCTVVAANYLPKALALADSLAIHEKGVDLHILLIDADADAVQPNVVVHRPADLGLPDGDFEHLAVSYDVVELSTAVKPVFLQLLLRDFEKVAYLDPDFWVCGPLTELRDGLDEHAILLTPHFLRPIAPGSSHMSEMHALALGIYNLGFCAVNRAALPFLQWWWSHLQHECLNYPLLHLFVDQKWADVGSVMYDAHALTHPGYNVGPWNLHERPISLVDGRPTVGDQAQALRIVHFSGFDPRSPRTLSTRLNESLSDKLGDTVAIDAIADEYAAAVLRHEELLGPPPAYALDADTAGRRISKRVRRSYRKAWLTAGGALPSPFDPDQSEQWRRWRRQSLRSQAADVLADTAIAAKYVLPDEYRWFTKRMPGVFGTARRRLLDESHVRR